MAQAVLSDSFILVYLCRARRWRFVHGYLKVALKGYDSYFDAVSYATINIDFDARIALDTCIRLTYRNISVGTCLWHVRCANPTSQSDGRTIICQLLESGTDGFEVTLHKASAACREIGAKNNRVRQDGLCNYLILTIFGENTQP